MFSEINRTAPRAEPAALDAYLWQKEIHSRLATGLEFFVRDLMQAEGAVVGPAGDETIAAMAGHRTGAAWSSLSGLVLAGLAVLAGVSVLAFVSSGIGNMPQMEAARPAARPAPEARVAAAVVRPVVARLAEIDAVGWVGADVAHEVGAAIRAGDKLELATGRLRLDFLCGASVWLTAPAIFETVSSQSGRLTAGRVQVTAATPEAKGFTIHTRTASVVDLGTEFTAEATLDGRFQVGVTSGEVRVQLASSAAGHLLKAGDMMNVEPGAAQVAVRIERGDESPAFRFPSIEPPSAEDFADSSRGNASTRCVLGRLYENRNIRFFSPGPEILVDGKGQSSADSPHESLHFANDETGGILVDLGHVAAVMKVNVYSWHRCLNPGFATPIREAHRERAAQKYVLYGSVASEPPKFGDHPAKNGWTLIARVNSDDYFGLTGIQRPAQQASSIGSGRGTIGRFRHLLFIVQPTAGVNHDGREQNFSTLFGEIDVYAE